MSPRPGHADASTQCEETEADQSFPYPKDPCLEKTPARALSARFLWQGRHRATQELHWLPSHLCPMDSWARKGPTWSPPLSMEHKTLQGFPGACFAFPFYYFFARFPSMTKLPGMRSGSISRQRFPPASDSPPHPSPLSDTSATRFLSTINRPFSPPVSLPTSHIFYLTEML